MYLRLPNSLLFVLCYILMGFGVYLVAVDSPFKWWFIIGEYSLLGTFGICQKFSFKRRKKRND